jgi:hypothetical protein
VCLVNSLWSGRSWVGSPNWKTELSLVQPVHSTSWARLCVQGLSVVISCLKLKVRTKLNRVPSLNMSGAVPLIHNLHRQHIL